MDANLGGTHGAVVADVNDGVYCNGASMLNGAIGDIGGGNKMLGGRVWYT